MEKIYVKELKLFLENNKENKEIIFKFDKTKEDANNHKGASERDSSNSEGAEPNDIGHLQVSFKPRGRKKKKRDNGNGHINAQEQV
jgi:hypothetical protein